MDPLISEDDRSVSSRPAGQPRRRSNADRLSDSSTVPHVPPTTGHLPSSPHICPRRIWLGFAVTSTVQGYGLALLPVGERGITASVCNSVCVSVSVREHISETTRPIIATFVLYIIPMVVVRSSTGGVAIYYLLPDSWMALTRGMRCNNGYTKNGSIGESTDLIKRHVRKLTNKRAALDGGRSLIPTTALIGLGDDQDLW